MIGNQKKGLFVTGTGTEVGKTYVTSLIAKGLCEAGFRVGVYKPVASGCVLRDNHLVSEDAEQLWLAAGKPRSLADVTPQAFAAPVAPNVSARLEGKHVDSHLIRSGFARWADSDFVLVEGVGGLLSPVSDDELVAAIAAEFGLPLLLVVGNHLGCINQTLLTLNAAEQYGLEVAGIILNDVRTVTDESASLNRGEIERLAGVSILAHVEHLADSIDVLSITN